MKRTCEQCGKLIGPTSKRCRSCAGKVQWQDPEALRKHVEKAKARWDRGVYGKRREQKYCADCGKLITRQAKRCLSCANEVKWDRGDFSERSTDDYRRKLSKAARAARARGDFDGVYVPPFESTEVPVACALEALGVPHVSQHRPNGCRFVFDEFVPPNVFIEVHGTYWHGPKRPKVQKRDTEKAMWAYENGFELVVIWEHELKELAKAFPVQKEVALVYAATKFVRERVSPLLAENAR